MKTLLLTGAHGDIGQAIQLKFLNESYVVHAPTRQDLNLETLEGCEPYVQSLKPCDVFIHCAGFNEPKSFVDIEWRDLEKTLTINALAFYQLSQSLIKQQKLKIGGHILGISSIYGIISRSNRFSYTASKYCLNGMVKNLALELGHLNIKTNALAPGFVDTKLTRKNNDEKTIAHLTQQVPLKRLATVEDMANIAYFLSSPQNNYINGQVVIADGGYSIGGFQS